MPDNWLALIILVLYTAPTINEVIGIIFKYYIIILCIISPVMLLYIKPPSKEDHVLNKRHSIN